MFGNLLSRSLTLYTNGVAGTPQKSEFIYDDPADNGQIVLQFQTTGSATPTSANLTDRYLWGPAVDQLIADEQVSGVSSPGTILWPLIDNQGTVRAVANSAGQLLDDITYSAFGQALSHTAANPAAVDTIFGYTGKYTDPATGLQWNEARWYNPVTATFTSRDPAQADPNSDRYADNGPTDGTDPSGLYEIDFHYYVIYYLFRSKGWTANDAREVAGFSQYTDDDPTTTPMPTNYADYNASRTAKFHFYLTPADRQPSATGEHTDFGSRLSSLFTGNDNPVKRDPPDLRDRIKSLFASYADDKSYVYELGAAIHTYADTWAHEGFSAVHSDHTNKRIGSIRPNIGHADADEDGHAPDHPYNDIPKALDAAEHIWQLIPAVRGAPNQIPWSTIKSDLTNAFKVDPLRWGTTVLVGPRQSPRRVPWTPTDQQRIEAIQKQIVMRFKDNRHDFAYDLNRYSSRAADFQRAVGTYIATKEELETERRNDDLMLDSVPKNPNWDWE